MSIKAKFAQKVAKLIFLEFKRESIPKVFGLEVIENLYMPVRPKRVMDKVKTGEKFENIPVSFFVEGMYYVLGGDIDFKYNDIYIQILNKNKEETTGYIKGIIFDEIKEGFYEDAYIMLKGLIEIEENEENYKKLFVLAENLIQMDNEYMEEYIEVLTRAIKLEGFNEPYYKKALVHYEKKEYDDAWYNLNTYMENTGDNSKEIIELKHILSNIRSFDKGKALVHDNPKEALNCLLPLLDEFEDDAILNFNIAVAYRVLRKYEKAIDYLNIALAIDSSIADVVNELGINYAALGEFDLAIQYLRKAFEATKAIEICTNLVMCYLNNGDKEQAKLHYDIAKKINPEDEIVLELGKFIN